MRRVVALGCGLVLLAGCATRGVVQVEGAANQVKPPPTTTPLPRGTPKSVDPVAVLRGDPKVSAKIKSLLVPCDGRYPVDAQYSDLTGDGVPDLVISVVQCPVKASAPVVRTGPGVAGYVYNIKSDPAVRLLGIEEAGVELVVETGYGLVVLHDTYQAGDDPCCPSDQQFSVYRWNGKKFVEGKK
jgi:hypothetical protein